MSEGAGSGRSLREKRRLDYKVLHSVGERVEKEESSLPSPVSDIMSETVKRLKVEERRIGRELEELVELDPLVEFSDVDVIDDHISELTRLSRKFRDVHYSLEDELDSEEYKKAYPKFEEVYSGFRKGIKDAKAAKSKLERMRELQEEQDRFKDQIDLVLCKIDGILESPVDSMFIVDDIRQNVREMSEQQVTCSYLVKKWNKLVGSEDPLHEDCLLKAKTYIQDGKAKIEKIVQASKDLESSQLEDEKKLRKKEQEAADRELALRQESIVSRQLEEIAFIESILLALKDVQVAISNNRPFRMKAL